MKISRALPTRSLLLIAMSSRSTSGAESEHHPSAPRGTRLQDAGGSDVACPTLPHLTKPFTHSQASLRFSHQCYHDLFTLTQTFLNPHSRPLSMTVGSTYTISEVLAVAGCHPFYSKAQYPPDQETIEAVRLKASRAPTEVSLRNWPLLQKKDLYVSGLLCSRASHS